MQMQFPNQLENIQIMKTIIKRKKNTKECLLVLEEHKLALRECQAKVKELNYPISSKHVNMVLISRK
ncbi:3786_t:CDS:2 [Ambispora gerdemannii]|uniref:3786_t:CDS:1 n=1 Tax=Ambispora gerdemannii TaxID=144530 RepID=A0A9N9C4K6_9GLOM|nr:3786_t:CDS:2 [Ambispora gerdemannii]